MTILLIGAGGTIGRRIYDAMSRKHDVARASRSGESISVDITSAESIQAMYEAVPDLDAVICAAGHAKFGPLAELSEDDFYVGIRDKLMGQLNLVLIGQRYLKDGGSFTLTTGILAEDPVAGSSALALVNGAVNSFAIAAAQELQRGMRINVVSPNVVADSAESYGDLFAGFDPAPMDRVVNAYIRSVQGLITGRIIKVY